MINKSSCMWNSNSKNCFCSEPSKIENYAKAIADTTQTWQCHHRLETHNSDGEKRLVELTAEELKALGMYYNRPPEEFIFLTEKDHKSLHLKGNTYNKGNTHHKGKKHSEEAKRKMSEAHRRMSAETKRKMSESRSKMGWKIDPTTGKRVYYKKEI